MPDPIGRLAMRAEGDFWNAYFAKIDTMDGAVLIGSIAINSVVDNPERKDAFMSMMKGIVTETLAGCGLQLAWPNPPDRAPEHERSGSA